MAVIDATGKFLEHVTIYPTPPHNKTEEARRVLLALLERHGVELIAVGSGTASRETDAFVASVLASSGAKAAKVTVNESGASIYSASETARAEFPDLDLTVRGAISIARRLQDPLAELVKIDPKSIGVGQYQHDVNQAKLRKMLDREVESCVNLVGVDLNTASVQLLSYVSGIGPKMAESIQRYRDAHGAFASRDALLSVPRLGSKVFQQAAGFLRVRGGRQPLDNSAVHPESYYVVEKMARAVAATPAVAGRQHGRDPPARSRPVCRRAGRPAHARRHPRRVGKAGPRSPAGVPRAAVRRRGPRDRRPARRHGPRRRRDERYPLRRLCRRGRPSGRVGPRLGARPPVHQGPQRGRRRRRYHSRESRAGGHRTPQDRPFPETGRFLKISGKNT